MSDAGFYYNIVCFVKCGDEHGSGFLVNNNTVITASHILAPHRLDKSLPVLVCFEGDDAQITCEVFSDGEDKNPISLLILPNEKQPSCKALSDAVPHGGELVIAYGFSSNYSHGVDRISAKCVRTFEAPVESIENSNASFNPFEERRTDFGGFSGSPIAFKGEIIGMLLAQRSNAGVADRLYGICGLAFRNYLFALGVSLPVKKSQVELSQSYNQQIVISTIVPTAISDTDILLGKLFEPARNFRERGQLLKSREALADFFNTLDTLNCSDQEKAKFFYLGAIWMRIDGFNESAEKYYDKAKGYAPNLNDKVYRAYELLQANQTSNAKEILLPVSDTIELNAFLTCMIEEKIPFTDILLKVEECAISKDCYTQRLLAIAALQSGEYSEGFDYIHKAAPAGIINSDNAIIESLLYYWSALGEMYPNTGHLGFAFATNRRFYPKKEQQQKLESAHAILRNALDKCDEDLAGVKKQMILCGLVIVSDLLPEQDSQYWLSKFKAVAPNHPFSIIYSISKHIELSEKERKDFLGCPNKGGNGIYAYAKLQLLLSLKRYDDAKAHFGQNQDSIIQYTSSSIAEEMLEMLIACQDYSAAKNLIGSVDLPPATKERYVLGIQFNQLPKERKELIKRALDFAEKTGQSLDYYNAGVLCGKLKKWQEAIKNAKHWWEKTHELIALEFLAEAYYNKENYRKCLKIIKKAESYGTLWNSIIKYRVDSLAALALYNEARTQSQALGLVVTNPRYSVWMARTYIKEGNLGKAINILSDYADQGLYDIELYELLIQLLQGSKPDLAYHYAEQLYHQYPNDTKVTRFVGQVALMTGHDNKDISSAFFNQIQNSAGADSDFRMVTIDEIFEIIRDENERRHAIEEKYENLEIPIHAIISCRNQCFGELLCSTYNNHMPYFGRFGIPKEIYINRKTPLVLDYTACLTLCRLNIFEKVCRAFKQIWLNSHIFELWIQDLNNLTRVQQHIVNKEIKLSEELKELKYNTYSDDDLLMDNVSYYPSDYVTFKQAKAENALLVGYEPAGRILGKSVPEGWDDLFVDSRDFYAALEQLGLRHPAFDSEDVNPKLVKRVVPRCSLILSSDVMAELANIDALEDVFTYFRIWISQDLEESIHAQAEAHCNRRKTAEWLKSALDIVRENYNNGYVVLQPFTTKKVGYEVEPPLRLLVEELSAACTQTLCLAVDDRWCSSYYRIKTRGKPSFIYTTYDIICFLNVEKVISDSEFYNLIDRLIGDGYCFFVPPAEYFVSRLNLASVSAEGLLKETKVLGSLRRMVSFAIESEKGASAKVGNASQIPEIGGFIMELHQELNKCLRLIWNSDKEIAWLEAASEWMMTFFGDFVCDTNKLAVNEISVFSMELSSLFLNCCFQEASDMRKSFAEWATSKIIIPCTMSKDVLRKTTHSLCQTLNEINEPTDDMAWNSDDFSHYAQRIKYRVLSLSPNTIRQELLKSKLFSDISEASELGEKLESNILPLFNNAESHYCIDTEGILSGVSEATENAILFLCMDPENNIDLLLEQLPYSILEKAPLPVIPLLCKFLMDLSWYAPVEKRKAIFSLKRKLSLLF